MLVAGSRYSGVDPVAHSLIKETGDALRASRPQLSRNSIWCGQDAPAIRGTVVSLRALLPLSVIPVEGREVEGGFGVKKIRGDSASLGLSASRPPNRHHFLSLSHLMERSEIALRNSLLFLGQAVNWPHLIN